MVGRVGAGHSVGNVYQVCHGSDTLDRVDFFRNWGRVSNNTRLVYLHGLNNPDNRVFSFLQSDHSGPAFALTACRNQVGYTIFLYLNTSINLLYQPKSLNLSVIFDL